MPTADSGDGARHERVLVMLANAENRRLLEDALRGRYDVVYDVRDRDADLCIADGLSLHEHWTAVLDMRRAQEPLHLPVLLLVDRRDVGLVTRDAWRVVDDLLLRPVERLELAARVETMLRTRRLSMRLHAVTERLDYEQRIALRLQEAALPRDLPRMPGLIFDAFYQAGADDARIGGDWYDAVRIADGRIVFSIGDVDGSGLDAAVTMANVRQVLRGVAHVHADPSLMLDAADRTLQAEGSGRIVTAFVGVFDPVTGELAYASAGHPRPLLCDGDRVRELQADGVPLGASRTARAVEVATLSDDALLVLYTDGLTEPSRDVAGAEERLKTLVCDSVKRDSPTLAREIHQAVVGDLGHDDVAVLTMRRFDATADGAIVRSQVPSHDAASAREARRRVSELLVAQGFDAEALAAAETVFAELLGNVVRYAPGNAEIVLDCTGASPVLHVLDRGSGFRHLPKLPADLLSERGRGLYIVSALTDDLSVTRRHDGGSHARAVLSPKVASTPLFAPYVADVDSLAAD
ncbi:MAG TPA: fused response regulator/phosphatase [Candidatus Baltobacteraceae bacterium]|nr:fused response regulator/phosphatase [Candidatus Baltobacteraceae bacterium]